MKYLAAILLVALVGCQQVEPPKSIDHLQSFVIQYHIDSAMKMGDHGYVSLVSDSDALLGFDGKRIDLNTSPQLINDITPGDKATITIYFTTASRP